MSTVLYHWTPRSNLKSILRRGLLKSFSRGKSQRVWGCLPCMTLWARYHVAKRHDTHPDKLVLLTFVVEDSRLCRFATRGVFYLAENVPASAIQVYEGEV